MHHNNTQEPIYQDPVQYNQIARHIEEVFNTEGHKLQKVCELAQKIKKGIEKINPFVQQGTDAVCPGCTNVCCVNKHGYYNYEDLVYICALGLKIPDYDFEKKDSTPCQFLSERGCVMDRSVRPSGCNWYFCESLFEFMESKPDYGKFDNELRDVAELWLELMDEFERGIKRMETAE
jgi:hypothetical protein